MSDKIIPDALLEYGDASFLQIHYVQEVNEHGGIKPAARALGVHHSSIQEQLKKLKAKASIRGYSPEHDMVHVVPETRMANDSACNIVQQGARALGAFRPANTDSVWGRITKAARQGAAPGTGAGSGASRGKHILVLPDVQAKPGNDFSFLMRIGQYMVEKQPDRVICIGDFADMQSLSSYDKGKKSYEGRRYKRDIAASHEAMSAFLTPLADYNARAEKNGTAPYRPAMDLFEGNHEFRINRAVNEDPKLDGIMSIDDLQYKDFGWTVHPFLEVAVIEGVAFSHYFTSGVMGRPVSTAQACLTKKHMSCVQGHQQGLQIATGYRGDGTLLTSIIAGSCYEHDEEYLGAQGNKHWRGFLMLHDVHDGMFDLMPVSLSYINQKYPHLSVARDFAKNPQTELCLA
jgi:hypothetical protein